MTCIENPTVCKPQYASFAAKTCIKNSASLKIFLHVPLLRNTCLFRDSNAKTLTGFITDCRQRGQGMEQSGHLKSESTSPKTPNEQNFGVGDSPLSAILATELLTLRPVRAPDNQLENAALVSLAETLARPKEDALQKLVDHARQLCEAHSAGLSVVDVEGAQPVFRWLAISGELAPFKNGIMPRFFRPAAKSWNARHHSCSSIPFVITLILPPSKSTSMRCCLSLSIKVPILSAQSGS